MMCSARMKRIFQLCFCIGALISPWCILVYMMLAPVNEHTAINEKTKSRNNKWVHLGDEKRETVSPRNNFEDLNTSNLYFDIKITILATVPIMLMILICWYFRNVIKAGRRADSTTDRHNVVVRYQNDRVILGLGNPADNENNNF